jgi:hypothetical protein
MMPTPSISARVTILMVAIVLAAPIVTNILLAMAQKA